MQDMLNFENSIFKEKYSFGREYKPRLSISLHTDWGIEGGIGSEQHLDVTYLSSQLSIATRYCYLCDDFKIPFIISENMYKIGRAHV